MRTYLSTYFKNFRSNLLGGLTAGIVALPLALAFGEQTEMGAIAGLYGAIVLGIVAAIFGGTKTQISGPTAPMTVVSAVIIADAIAYTEGNIDTALPIIIATFFLAGLFEMSMGVLRFGKYIKYIPYPVVSGFMSGIGVIIVITQLFPFLGVSAPAGGPLGTIRSMHMIPEVVNVYSIGTALITILLIYLIPRFTKKIPSTLIALVLISVCAYLFIPADALLRINTDGPIPRGLPDLQLGFVQVFSNFEHLVIIFEYVFTLGALGALDSLLTSIVADNMTRTNHKSDRELIGQGLGNMAAAIFGGLPGAGATMRTVININSGGSERSSGVIAGLFLLAVLLGLGAFVGHVPNAVLAGILFTVGVGIIDYKGLRHLRKIPRADAIVMILVLVCTVFVDLIVAVGIGMVLASLLFMKNIADVAELRTRVGPMIKFTREIPWRDDEDIIKRYGDKVFIKHLDGPLFFGFASRFNLMIKALPEVEVVVMRMEKVPYMDQSGLYAMEEAIEFFHRQHIDVVFTGLHGQPEDMIRAIRVVPSLVPEDHTFEEFEDCARWLDENFTQEHGLIPGKSGARKKQNGA